MNGTVPAVGAGNGTATGSSSVGAATGAGSAARGEGTWLVAACLGRISERGVTGERHEHSGRGGV